MGRIIGGAFALLIAAIATCAAAEPVESKPNIVLIFCDDLGYGDLGCYGNTEIRTPNIDALASSGARLTQYYVSCSVCTPSRAALLTGRQQLRVGLPDVLGPKATIGLRAADRTIAQALKERGYATACVGKWHLGHLPEFLPTKHGFDSYYGLPYSNDMGREKQGEAPVPLIENETIIEQPAIQETLTMRYTERATKFLRGNADRPFFLYLPHTFPHVPLYASEKFRGKSKAGKYGDAVEEIDWSVGEIMKTLRELGIEKRTLVMFSSDNGPWLSQGKNAGSAGPLRDGKATAYEGGIRVPFIAHWPGRIPAGATINQPIISHDLFPTLLKLAEGDVAKEKLDGQDAWPIIAKGEARTNAEFVIYRGATMHAVRQGDWKLHLPRDKDGTSTPLELYNIAKDESEKLNLADANPEIVERMREAGNRWDKSIRSDYRAHPNFAARRNAR